MQCWIHITGLLQEYWRPRILFAIARGIGIPLSLDDATINKSLGHFARVLVDLDLAAPIRDKILVERKDFTFLVGIDYERLPLFCSSCMVIGHSLDNCGKNSLGKSAAVEPSTVPKPRQMYVPKARPEIDNKGKEVINVNGDRPSDDVLKPAVPFQEGTSRVIDNPVVNPMAGSANSFHEEELQEEYVRVEDIPQTILCPLVKRMSREEAEKNPNPILGFVNANPEDVHIELSKELSSTDKVVENVDDDLSHVSQTPHLQNQ